MSKQSEAKERQQYTPKLIPGACGNCAHLESELALAPWMVEHNEKRSHSSYFVPYTLEQHGLVKNMRCGIGGFAVKKMGSCSEHAFAATQE